MSKFQFNAINSTQANQYLDQLAENKRFGAKFFRDMFGFTNKSEAKGLDPDVLPVFFEIGLDPLNIEILRRAFNAMADMDAIKDIRNHIKNAFPDTIKRIGMTIRKGDAIDVGKVWQGFPTSIRTYTFAKQETYSIRWNWEILTKKDISDKTELRNDTVVDPSQGPIENPRELAPIPRDQGFSNSEVRIIKEKAVIRGYDAGFKKGSDMVDWVIELIEQRAIARVNGIEFPIPVKKEIISHGSDCGHKGMTIKEIDNFILSRPEFKVTRNTRNSRKVTIQA